jgi:hypothetical protein
MLMDDQFAVSGRRKDRLAFIKPAGYGGAGQRPDGSDQGRTYPKDMELWAAMLEMAYCKVNSPTDTGLGTYASNNGGLTHKAIKILTGLNGTIVTKRRMPHLWNPERLWPIIKDGCAKNDILACGTSSVAGMNHHDDAGNGLCPGHAYSILQAKEIDGIKFVQIMNPWGCGEGEWTGDWSDHSPKWTRRMKAKLDFHDKADGHFWMTIEDWVNSFGMFFWNSREQMNLLGGPPVDWKVGMRVRAITNFCHQRDKSVKVRKGMTGKIVTIDKDGDFLCTWEQIEGGRKRMWSFRKSAEIVPI